MNSSGRCGRGGPPANWRTVGGCDLNGARQLRPIPLRAEPCERAWASSYATQTKTRSIGSMHLTRSLLVAAERERVRAARRLRLTQPALSRQLAALEQEVGTPLFERHARGVRLLPAGEALLAHARRVLAEAEIGVSAARDAARGNLGSELRLAMPDTPARAAWIGRAVHCLRQ